MSLLSQRSLAGGELAPPLYVRTDTVKFQTGTRTSRNMIIRKSGGQANRPGSGFITEVKDSAKTVRLIPFVFNAEQTYMLEFGDLYMRVILDGEYVVDTAFRTLLSITQAAQGVFTTTLPHFLQNGREIIFDSILGMTELNNGETYTVSDKTTSSFKLKHKDGTYLDTSAFTAFTSGTFEPIYEIITPYSESELMDLYPVQSADVITIAHPQHFLQDLIREAHDSWQINDKNLSPILLGPGSVNFSDSGAAANIYTYSYIVTSINEDTYEESFGGTMGTIAGAKEPTAANPHLVTWAAVTGAIGYNVYVVRSGSTGYLGAATGTGFSNPGITPDFTKTPPIEDTFFDAAEDYIAPSVVTYAQQRLLVGNNNYFGAAWQVEEVRASRVGLFNNFSTSFPTQEADAIRFRMAGRQVNEIRHLLDLSKLVIMTSGGEFTAEGNGNGSITPTSINTKQYSYNGSSKRIPIVIDSTALYVQARGNVVRDIGFDYTVDGYQGNDLTVFSSHLFKGIEIVDWAFQKIPDSVAWAVTSDGTLLTLTYVREHQIWGWTRQDTDGFVERIACIPEGTEDSVYMVVRRTIGEREVRYIERIGTRIIDDVRDMKFMDSYLTYDGRNSDDSHTLKIQQLGGGWGYAAQKALVSNTSYFTAGEIGNEYQLTDEDGDTVVFIVEDYFDATTVFGRTDKDVAAGLQNITTSSWVRAVDQLSGLSHLEGKEVSILGDGYVVSSPYNPDIDTITVSGSGVTLERCYGVIHVGLPYLCDLETLTVDSPNAESLADKMSLVTEVIANVFETRGLWAGTKPPTDDEVDATEGLYEAKVRDLENYDQPVALTTGNIDIKTQATWNDNGRVFIRQIDPLPVYICGIHIGGEFPFKAG
jgi:hypothetical protein